MEVLFNPVLISVIILCLLCVFKVNVLFSLMISSIVAGLISKMPMDKIMDLFISGMGQNSETALSYILLGTLAAAAMLFIGLIITIGIGSSFGTIPILAVLFMPLCLKLGFSAPQSIVLLCAASALGDAGSPASDTTLGPTAGLNADGQHNHIKDTCIPTFIHFNTALILAALIAVL